VENVLMQAESLPMRKPSLETVLKAVTKIYDLQEVDLSTAGQKRLPPEARSLAAWGVLELSDATLNELAVRLGRDASTLSSAVKRFDRRCYNEPELKEKIEQLKREVEVAALQARPCCTV